MDQKETSSLVKSNDNVIKYKDLRRISMMEFFNGVDFYIDESTNTFIIDTNDKNLVLASLNGIGIVSGKDVKIVTGNGLDDKRDGFLYLN